MDIQTLGLLFYLFIIIFLLLGPIIIIFIVVSSFSSQLYGQWNEEESIRILRTSACIIK